MTTDMFRFLIVNSRPFRVHDLSQYNNYHRIFNTCKKRMIIVEQELLIVSEHLFSSMHISGIHVAQYLCFCVDNFLPLYCLCSALRLSVLIIPYLIFNVL